MCDSNAALLLVGLVVRWGSCEGRYTGSGLEEEAKGPQGKYAKELDNALPISFCSSFPN